MASANRIRVTLGNPIPKLNAHKSLVVHQGDDENALEISFMRTIRVPDNEKTYALPPGLGHFPLYNITQYTDTLPEVMALKGGCFMPVHDREALWISFKSTRPFAVKIYLGGINAISGEPIIGNFATALRRSRLLKEKKTIQDYVVVDPTEEGQLWLDGVAKLNGKVMQFVAVKSGSGYSVESQISSIDGTGGIQILVTPLYSGPTVMLIVKRLGAKCLNIHIQLSATVWQLLNRIAELICVPAEQLDLLFKNRRLEHNYILSYYAIKANSQVHLVISLTGGGLSNNTSIGDHNTGEMGIGAGGLIKQSILRDPHPPTAWDSANTAVFNVQLLNTNIFERVTCLKALLSPVTAASYAAAGLPFFELPEEEDNGVVGDFEGVKSVTQLDMERSGSINKFMETHLQFPIVQLDRSGFAAAAGFMAVGDMEESVKKWNIGGYES